MKEMICICCPIGCRLSVDDSDKNDVKVSGNTCPRGAKYARDEAVRPVRTVTGTVRVNGGIEAMASVKTAAAIPKAVIFDALEALKKTEIDAPIAIGDVVVKDVCGTGIDIVATKNVAART